MIKYEISNPSNGKLEISGSFDVIGCEAALMLVKIYKEVLNRDPKEAVQFRMATMYAINRAMDMVERGEFDHDSNN